MKTWRIFSHLWLISPKCNGLYIKGEMDGFISSFRINILRRLVLLFIFFAPSISVQSCGPELTSPFNGVSEFLPIHRLHRGAIAASLRSRITAVVSDLTFCHYSVPFALAAKLILLHHTSTWSLPCSETFRSSPVPPELSPKAVPSCPLVATCWLSVPDSRHNQGCRE